MEASSHIEPKRLDTLRYGAGAADCAGGTIECSKEPVAGRVYLAAVETGEFAAHKIVVTVKQVVPATSSGGPAPRKIRRSRWTPYLPPLVKCLCRAPLRIWLRARD
jgi:hypothetical protein